MSTQNYSSLRTDAAEREIRCYRHRIQKMFDELSTAEARQRRLIVSEIHDGLIQSLAVAKMRIGRVMALIKQPHLKEQVAEVDAVLNQAIGESRSVMHAASPPELAKRGFGAAIHWLSNHFVKRFGISIIVDDQGGHEYLNTPTQTFLYSAVRELLMNIIRHANANRIVIALRAHRGTLCISVDDDGDGCDPSAIKAIPDDKGGFGLWNIQRRLDCIGGALGIKSNAHGGACLEMTVPIAELSIQ